VLNVAFFRGSYAEMGRQHGARERNAIGETLRAYSEHLGGKWEKMPLLVQALERQHEFLPPEGFEELRGMAEACEIPVEQLLAFNFGLGMERVAGCSRLAIPARHNGTHGAIHATNEDLVLSLVLGEPLRRIVQVRHPPAGIPHVLFSTSGQLGALNGFNAAGLCITSTLLLDRSPPGMPTPGWLHSFVVQTLLQQAENTAEAVRLLRAARRCGAWSVCLSDTAADSLVYVEYDGDQLWEHTPADGRFFSTNHALLAEHIQPVLEGSRHRYERLEELFKSNEEGGYSAAAVQSILGDVFDRERGRVVRHPTMNTIRRPDTRASIVMCPSSDEVWVAQDCKPGPDESRRFTRLAMSELFDVAGEEEEQQGASSRPSRTMRRFVLRASEVPLPSGGLSAWRLCGRVMVLGGGNLSVELSRRLEAEGHAVVSLPMTADAEIALAEFAKLCANGRPESVLIADDEPVTDDLSVPRALTLYRVLQAWLSGLSEAQLARAALVALTSVGADFGWTSPVLRHVGGGIAGLCKALYREFPAMRVLVMDTPRLGSQLL
jgi:hypothetical protein